MTRPHIVLQLRALFRFHDREETRLVRRIRQGTVTDADFRHHDQLERDILYAMAAATTAEIEAAQTA